MKILNRKRVLSFLLSLAMFVSLIPSSAFTIFAADEVGSSSTSTESESAKNEFEANVGKQAIIDVGCYFVGVYVGDEDYAKGNDDGIIDEFDYDPFSIESHRFVAIVEDYCYNTRGEHWYKLAPREGEEDRFPLSNPWVFHTSDEDIADNAEPALIFYGEDETVRFEESSLQLAGEAKPKTVLFVVAGPAALKDAVVDIQHIVVDEENPRTYPVSPLAFTEPINNSTFSKAYSFYIGKPVDGSVDENGELITTPWTADDGTISVRYDFDHMGLDTYFDVAYDENGNIIYDDNGIPEQGEEIYIDYGAAFMYADGNLFSADIMNMVEELSDIVYTNNGNSVLVFEHMPESFEWLAEPAYFTNDAVTLYDNNFNAKEYLAANLPVTFTAGYVFTHNDEEYYWLESDGLIGSPYFLVKAADVTLGKLPEEFGDGRVSITDKDGNAINSITLPQYEKPEFSAVSSLSQQTADVDYQWQIEYEAGKWVDILGEDEATVKLSYGIVATLLDENGQVNLRCETKAGSKTAYSAAIPVTLLWYEPEENGAESEENTEPAEPAAYNLRLARSNVMPLAEGEDSGSTTIHNIVINYVFQDGKQAANSWTATIEAGGSYSQTVKSPTVIGYAPDKDEVVVDVHNISEDVTYTVIYYPAEVNYTVVHQFQNVSDEGYYEFSRITKKGYTDSAVGAGLGLTADQMAAEGVYALPYDVEQKIASDGSTEVIIKYDRYYFLMTFDLSGGYNVEPIYARVGTTISVGIPIRAGYVFEGWEPALPSTMPNEDSHIVALWSPNPDGVKYFIAYWAENANDDGYSILKVETHDGVPGSTVSGGNTYGTLTGFHFDRADQNVTVKGDGSTVINVYYKRNTYDLIFAYSNGPLICDVHVHSSSCYELSCGKTEHEHSNSCCEYGGTSWTHWRHDDDCCTQGLEEHTHSTSCYSGSPQCGLTGVTNHTHSVQNGCYGVKFEGIKYGQDTSVYWSQAPLMKWKVTYSGSTFYTAAPAMPNSDLIIYGTSQSGSSTIHYYEYKNGQTTIQVRPDYTVGTDGWSFTSEDYIEIPGFTYHSSSKNNAGTQYYIYYTRNDYNLSFKNGSELIDKGDFLYQADISGVIDSDDRLKNPTYTGDDPEGFVFGGWYTTEQCLEGTEWNSEGATMPFNNLILYAKWAPVQHEVKLYITKADMEAGKQYLNTMLVDHNTPVQESAVSIPDNGDYKFVGWFYEEDGVEKGFDLEMPVRQDLNLYGKWYADELATYTIKYAVKNGDTLTYIADDTTGYAIAGYDKTFDAKFGNDLYEEYRTGYYPETNSHSLPILLGENNVYTFIYVEKESVKYTVQYLEKETREVLHTEKTESTKEAIHTENFVYISGYRPDAYQKRIILSANEEENVITFWYEKDTTHAPVLVKHYLQNVDGKTYNTSNPYSTTTDLEGLIDSAYTVNIFTNLAGFKFAKAEASHEVDGKKETVEITIGGTQVSAVVTAQGLLIELYYDRISYPYEFQFILQGTDTALRDPIKGSAIFGSQVTQAAVTIPGYTCQTENQAIIIQIEDGTTAVKNVRIFYYVEETVNIQYVVVGPQDSGTVTPTFQNNIPVLSGLVSGSTAVPNAGFKFVGWFEDEDCTISVNAAWINGDKITPAKTKAYGDKMGYESATYYAKFDYDLTSLTIVKDGADAYKDIDPNQTFIFDIYDGDTLVTTVTVHAGTNWKVIVDGLTVGKTYRIVERTDWSWRYNCTGWVHSNGGSDTNTNEATITLGLDGTITFTNERGPDQWLDGDAWCDNIFNQN